MPKSQRKGHATTAGNGAPYNKKAAAKIAANNVFKMNTDLGQHVLKNPGVATAIVDKAGLKQTDVHLACTPAIVLNLLMGW